MKWEIGPFRKLIQSAELYKVAIITTNEAA